MQLRIFCPHRPGRKPADSKFPGGGDRLITDLHPITPGIKGALAVFSGLASGGRFSALEKMPVILTNRQ